MNILKLQWHIILISFQACFLASLTNGMEREIKVTELQEKALHLSKHAEERMILRGFSAQMITKIISKGCPQSVRGDSLKYTFENKVVITDSETMNIITVYNTKDTSPNRHNWQTLTPKQREKIARALMRSNFHGDDLLAYFYRLCAKNRDIAKHKARDVKKKGLF